MQVRFLHGLYDDLHPKTPVNGDVNVSLFLDIDAPKDVLVVPIPVPVTMSDTLVMFSYVPQVGDAVGSRDDTFGEDSGMPLMLS